MSTRYICPVRVKRCRGVCKGAYAHKCTPGDESHGCNLYISQKFCIRVRARKKNWFEHIFERIEAAVLAQQQAK